MKYLFSLIITISFSQIASAQCGSTLKGAMKALSNDEITEANTLFTQVLQEYKVGEEQGDTVKAECYAKYYFGYGTTIFQEHEDGSDKDLVVKISLLNKAETEFKKLYGMKEIPKDIKAKADAVFEALANRQKNIGYDYFQKQNFTAALAQFEKSIQNKSILGDNYLDMHAYQSAAITAINAGEFEKALQFNETLIKHPELKIDKKDNALKPNLIRKAEVLNELGRKEEAILVIDNVDTTLKNDYSAQLLKLRIFMDLKRNDEALVLLEKLTSQNNSREDLFVVKGQLYEAKGESSKAFAAYQQAQTINPNGTIALYGMGTFYIGKFNELGKKLNEEKVSVETQNELEKDREKALSQALNYFNKILVIDPNDRSTLLALKSIYEIKEDPVKLAEIEAKLLGGNKE